MKSDIVCIGNGPVMSFTPYMAKLALTLDSLGYKTKFITWCRLSDQTTAKDPDSVVVHTIYRRGRSGNTSTSLVFMYLFWMIKLFFYILKSRDKNYICSRFENCFPVWLASKFRPISYIYADRDALHSTYNWPTPLKFLIKKIETKIALAAQFHLIPGKSRDFTFSDNVRVVPNVPATWIVKTAIALSKNRTKKKENFTVYINGWLAPTRGRDQILNVISSAKLKHRVDFIVAGDMSPDHIDVMKRQKNVTYLGRLSNELALSYYYSSDVVVSLYDPTIEINTKAEPNKWWDCVVTKTPFITNFGISTLPLFEGLVEYDVIDYFKHNSLENCLIKRSNEYECAALESNEDFSGLVLWDIQIRDLLDEFIETGHNNVQK